MFLNDMELIHSMLQTRYRFCTLLNFLRFSLGRRTRPICHIRGRVLYRYTYQRRFLSLCSREPQLGFARVARRTQTPAALALAALVRLVGGELHLVCLQPAPRGTRTGFRTRTSTSQRQCRRGARGRRRHAHAAFARSLESRSRALCSQ